MLNKDTITKLIELNKDDRKTLEFIKSRIDSFEQYHRAVFDDQMFQLFYVGSAIEGDEYREGRTAVDKTRTIYHNSVITSVSILNRLADKAGLDPIYDGVVSEEQPYRRQIANAVFEYIESIINNRT
ncbi:MAG: DUF3232 domain-containing protein [Firmicutes bacterium]|nr:DUF3232 domain-containing protein [Bacillota bacterium]